MSVSGGLCFERRGRQAKARPGLRSALSSPLSYGTPAQVGSEGLEDTGYEHPLSSPLDLPCSRHFTSPSGREGREWTLSLPFLLVCHMASAMPSELAGSKSLKGQSFCSNASQGVPPSHGGQRGGKGPGDGAKEKGTREEEGEREARGGRHIPVCGTSGSCHPQEDAAPGPRRCSWQ